MRSGCPAVIIPLPGAVFNSSVPVELCVVMAVVKLETALEVEAISWRMGVWGTNAVDVETGAEMEGAVVTAAAVLVSGTAVVVVCFTSTEDRAGH